MNKILRKQSLNPTVTLMEVDAPLAKKMRWRSLNFWLNLPGRFGQYVCCFAYNLAHKFVKFN